MGLANDCSFTDYPFIWTLEVLFSISPDPSCPSPPLPGTDPGARCTNSRSGPRTSPKFVKIIPDKLC